MGSPRRRRKLYEKPKRLWDAERLEEEHKLLDEYGLKNMRELWRMETILRKIRREARRLLALRGAGVEARTKRLLERVSKFLIKKTQVSLDDVLALSTRDILERRLQTIVLRKGLASTAKQARQLIAHSHVAVDGVKNSSPSRLIAFDEETKISWYAKPVRVLASAPAGDAPLAEKAAA